MLQRAKASFDLQASYRSREEKPPVAVAHRRSNIRAICLQVSSSGSVMPARLSMDEEPPSTTAAGTTAERENRRQRRRSLVSPWSVAVVAGWCRRGDDIIRQLRQ